MSKKQDIITNSQEVDKISCCLEYSICTLVTNKKQYKAMQQSFVKAGFNEKNSQFIYVDNSSNKYDAYQGLNKLITASQAKYIILCHQDIELLYDKKAKLDQCLKQLDNRDPSWAVAGNAGGYDLEKLAICISDPHGKFKRGKFPQKVDSLDENFILIKKSANLSLSYDLHGFHFYGSDICILANIRGLTCYVIDFHLHHHSGGNANEEFYRQRKKIIQKYNRAFKTKLILTTCTTFFISSSTLLSYFSSSKFLFKKTRSLYKLPFKFTKLIKKIFK